MKMVSLMLYGRIFYRSDVNIYKIPFEYHSEGILVCVIRPAMVIHDYSKVIKEQDIYE